MADMYTKKVMKHFFHPHNQGEIKDADGIGRVGNIICGDVMWVYIKVSEKKEGSKNKSKAASKKSEPYIKDMKFKTLGCAAAISTASMITDIAKGKTIKEALKISNKDIADSLGGLPPIKMHCSVLAADALKEAVYDYMTKKRIKIPQDLKKFHEKTYKELAESEKKYKNFKDSQKKVCRL